MPADLPPLLTQARLILDLGDADPFRATGKLTGAARFVPPDKVEAFLADAGQPRSSGGGRFSWMTPTRRRRTQPPCRARVTVTFALAPLPTHEQ
jgi:hypothetical protein